MKPTISDVLHQVNVIQARLQELQDGELSHTRLRILADQVELAHSIIDRRHKPRGVEV
jgi:hypothetical protein